MKKCRILLRPAASADEEKIFCNLVGRNLINSSENDDEGLLGSPGMVSRPLDFRTIDLRLAFGAYSGSHEAFLEDVRELWKNISVSHTEQPELVQLAERLSENFESLYEEEVVALVEKLKDYSKMEQISAKAKKEIEEVLASTSDIPKAPWDEGVCKVCGIDRDDDSVLLCDTCDAEYLTYCLNPPLARIPEGNWYCPSCVSGVNVLEGTYRGVKFNGQRHRRKNHGEGIRNYLEELTRLAAVLEQEYWEFSVDEKILLLKFLCDEVLNSILIRQHLEQCFETSADLQQKLRVLYSEWKNLKLREVILATTATKFGPNVPVVAGDTSTERNIGTVANSTNGTELQHAVNESDRIPSLSDSAEVKVDASVLHLNKHSRRQNVIHLEKINSDSQVKPPVDSEFQVKDLVATVSEDNASVENHVIHERSSKRHKSSLFQDCSVSDVLLPETSGMDCESSCQDRIHEPSMPDVSTVGRSEGAVSPGPANNEVAETVACLTSNVLQSSNLKLNGVQKELSVLRQSIANAESLLMKSSVRMEFLGIDSSGRFYWASAQPGTQPRVIVDGTMALQPRSQLVGYASIGSAGFSFENLSCDNRLSSEGSSAACPFVYGNDCSHPTCSQWAYYQSEEEIKELVKSLNLNNPKERELKDSILNWHKLRCHELHQTGCHDKIPLSVSMSAEENDMPGVLATRADTLLERKYGPFCEADTLEEIKKRLSRSRGTSDEKLYRCRCLEPIWLSRLHCLSYHRTFYSVEELDNHNSGKCRSSLTIPSKRKESGEPVEGRITRKSEAQQNFPIATDGVQASKNADSDRSRYIRFQNEGSILCPHKFEDISAKFVANDSIKELVRGIGLIGSEGMPSFIPSMSPYLDDPTLRVVVSKQDVAADVDRCRIPELAASQSDQLASKSCIGNVADPGTRRFLPSKHDEILETSLLLPGIPHDRSKKSLASNFASSIMTDPYCMVPVSSLKPVGGRAGEILRLLKICLLDMEVALPD